MTPIAALLPGSDFTIKKKTESELYLPKWVRTKPEDMLKNNLDLSQVKLPGRKQNLNELENLYKTYQSIVMPQPKKVRKKRKTRNDKSIRSLKTNSKGNKSMYKTQAIEGAVITQEETNVEGRSAEYDPEAYDEQVDIISRARMTLSPANQLKFKAKTISSKENRNITNLQTKNTKDSLLNSQVKNDSETALQLKEKLSLTTVFRRKATLLSLTTVKNKKSSAAANKSPVLPLNNTL